MHAGQANQIEMAWEQYYAFQLHYCSLALCTTWEMAKVFRVHITEFYKSNRGLLGNCEFGRCEGSRGKATVKYIDLDILAMTSREETASLDAG